MKRERKGAAVYIRFAVFIVVCAALGAAAGFFAAMAGEICRSPWRIGPGP